MYIKNFSIKNFRTLKNFNIIFNDSFNVIIGENNTGKSNILLALDKIINNEAIFTDDDMSNINNTGHIQPSFELKTYISSSLHNFHFKNNRFINTTVHSYDQNYFNKQIKKIKLIHIDIHNKYNPLVKLIEESYSELSPLQQKTLDTQINIDFTNVIGKGNYIYFKNNGIYLIDEYSNNEILENKSSGLQRVTIIICLLNLFKVSNKLSTYILMVDEPEANLHLRAQKKILYLLRDFSEKHQVIVSTHSTVFLDNIKENELNYVDRNTNEGSFLDNKNIGTNNFLRLRNSLGVEVTDTLFIGNKIILVEGEADVILHTYIYDRLYPNESKITFFTMEGATNAPQNVIAFTQIIGKPLTIILDNDNAGRNIAKSIEKNSFIQKTNILYQPLEVKNNQNKELEDLFPKDFITKTIKNYIELPDPSKTLKSMFGKDYESLMTEYLIKLDSFENYSDIEVIGGNEKFNLSTEAFARRVRYELNLLDNEEFINITKYFKIIYARL